MADSCDVDKLMDYFEDNVNKLVSQTQVKQLVGMQKCFQKRFEKLKEMGAVEEVSRMAAEDNGDIAADLTTEYLTERAKKCFAKPHSLFARKAVSAQFAACMCSLYKYGEQGQRMR